MNATKEHLQTMFNDDLASQFPMEWKASTRILDFVSSERKENLTHISFGKLFEVSGVDSMTKVAKTAQYLTGARAELLELKFEFVDGDFTVDVSYDDVHHLRETGEFKHPLTGELVVDAESKVFMYFGLGVNGLEAAL
jgi:hypothetical protein